MMAQLILIRLSINTSTTIIYLIKSISIIIKERKCVRKQIPICRDDDKKRGLTKTTVSPQKLCQRKQRKSQIG